MMKKLIIGLVVGCAVGYFGLKAYNWYEEYEALKFACIHLGYNWEAGDCFDDMGSVLTKETGQ